MSLRYRAFATDGDGTLTIWGLMARATRQALVRLRDSGRKLILVTGETHDQVGDFHHVELFDLVVAEEGGILYHPRMRRTTALAHKPPVRLIKALEAQGVTPNVDRVALCTKRKHEPIFRAVLRNLKLDYELSFNGKSMMATPKGINKRTGLAAALDELGLKLRHVVGIGDGENDVPLLKGCAFGVAVANAVDELKAQAGHVTQGRAGRGVCELIDQLLNDDLRAWQHGRLA